MAIGSFILSGIIFIGFVSVVATFVGGRDGICAGLLELFAIFFATLWVFIIGAIIVLMVMSTVIFANCGIQGVEIMACVLQHF